MNFQSLCELGMKAKLIARKLGHQVAAMFLKAKGVVLKDALSIFGFSQWKRELQQTLSSIARAFQAA